MAIDKQEAIRVLRQMQAYLWERYQFAFKSSSTEDARSAENKVIRSERKERYDAVSFALEELEKKKIDE